jgi:guanylate kinase
MTDRLQDILGVLYIISAPSGGGKTSLVKAVTDAMEGVVISVSYTTRPPREGEQDGVNYHFVTRAEFDGMLQGDAFLEHAEVYGYCYGTSRAYVIERLRQGVDVILEIDWQGAQQVRRAFADCVSVFILPPSLDALALRLRQRGQDSEAVMERRLRAAVNEISHYRDYDYLIVNDDFERAASNLSTILGVHRLSQRYQSVSLAPLLRGLLESGV